MRDIHEDDEIEEEDCEQSPEDNIGEGKET